MRRFLFFLAIILQIIGVWIALTAGKIAGPAANPDSPVRNILYSHIPSSVCALLCFAALLASSIGYLATSKSAYDCVALASAEVAFLFASILNATGMIFSRAEWNIWWTPSPRLISSAILWFLAVVYLILRISLADSPRRQARICAVFGILAVLDVPMVFITARFMPDIHRANFSFDSRIQSVALMMLMFSTLLLAASLIWLRTDILRKQHKLRHRLFE